MHIAFALVIAYLLGSFPTAYLVTYWLRGQDIRRLGDMNAGATNVYFRVGPAAGIFVGAVDIAKGFAAVAFASFLGANDSIGVAAGLMAIAGHNWPVVLGFRGGNGTAPAIGALLALLPREVVAAYLIATLVFLLSRNWTLSGVLALSSVFPLSVALGAPTAKALGALLIPLFITLKILHQHRRVSRRHTGPPGGLA